MNGIKKVLAVFLALMIAVPAVFAAGADDAPLPEGFLTYTVADGKATVTGVTDRYYEGAITLPDYIEGCPVTNVTSGFFSGLRGYVTTLTLPSTLELIGGGNCGQTSIVERYAISSGNPYFSVDEAGALFDKAKTVLYRFPMVSPVTEYEIPDSVTVLQTYAFANMNVLEYVKVPSGVEAIPDMCFTFSHSLKTIELSEGVKTIGNNSISECRNLERVSLPSTLESIRATGISGCPKLRELVIPAAVREIVGVWAIGDNSGLERVVFLGEPEIIYSAALRGDTSLKEVRFTGSESAWNGNSYLAALDLQGAELRCGYVHLPDAETFFKDGFLSVDGAEEIPAVPDGGFADWTDYAADCEALRIGESVVSVGANAFADFGELTEVVTEGGAVAVASGAFAGCGKLDTVIALGDITPEKDALPDGASVYVPEGSGVNGDNVIKYNCKDGVLSFEGAIDTDAYRFLDTVAVLCGKVGTVSEIRVTSLRLSNVALTYIDKNGDRRYIEDNTLTDGAITAGATGGDGKEVALTFNDLCAGIADGTITSFYLSTSMEQDDEQIDSQVDFNIVEQIVIVFRKILKTIVTLLNRLFKLIKGL
ncbi:MAG: leucine-rich repeat domain-containing protein [Clostridiales bacterium]|nr:leucine-rich repeat domain-containing protein [Clostridiales bacterium]